MEGLEVASARVATNSSLENGSRGGKLRGPAQEKDLEICGAERLG